MGISGGVDSAVASFLAVRAMGDPKKVYGLHLYDRDSQRKFREYAERLAGELGVNFEVRDISPTIKEKGTYDPLVMMRVPYLNLVNVYNQRNVLFYFFEYERTPPVRSGVSMFPVLPTFGVEVRF